MLSKTIVAALLATAVVALPAKTARNTITTPDFILKPMPIDDHYRPDAPEKRDPNSVVNFWTPTPDGEEAADLDKRFYIYHRPPPPGAESVEKRDPNSLVHLYIPDAPTPDAEEESTDLDKRFYIYHRPPYRSAGPLDEESEEKKRDLEPEWLHTPLSIDQPGRPSVSVKRDPNSSVNFWTPEAPADD